MSLMTRVAFTHGDPFLPVPFVACDIRDGPRGAPLACAIQWITSWMWPSSNIVQEMPVTRVLTLYLLDWDCIASFSVSTLYWGSAAPLIRELNAAVVAVGWQYMYGKVPRYVAAAKLWNATRKVSIPDRSPAVDAVTPDSGEARNLPYSSCAHYHSCKFPLYTCIVPVWWWPYNYTVCMGASVACVVTQGCSGKTWSEYTAGVSRQVYRSRRYTWRLSYLPTISQ